MAVTNLNTKPQHNKLLISLLALFGFAGAGLMLYATPWGVGLGFDSVAYISAARNFADGIGLGRLTCLGFKPLTLWPPLYPLVLSFFSLFRLDALVAARIISAVGFGMTIFLAGLLISRITKSLVFSLIGAGMIMLFSPILRTISWAMSEALYVPLALATIYFFGEYLEHPKQKYLIIGAILTSLTILTRYIGIALLFIGIVIIILDSKSSLGSRIKSILIFLATAGFPISVWLVRNEIVVHSGTNRKFGLHFPPMIEFDPFIKQITSWVLPVSYTVHRFRLLLIGLCFIGLVITTLIIIYKKRKESSSLYTYIFLFLLYTIIYPLVVIATIVFFTPSISIVDERILVPLLVGLLILFTLFLVLTWNSQRWFLRIIFILICLWIIFYHFPQQVETIKTLHADGQGFAARQWQESQAIDYLKSLPSEMIYTNDIQAVYFLADLKSCVLPNAEKALVEMQDNVRRENGSVILIGSHLPEFLPVEDIVEGMDMVKEFPNIRIYQYLRDAP